MRHILSNSRSFMLAGLALTILFACTPKSGEQEGSGEMRGSGLDSLIVSTNSSPSEDSHEPEKPKQYHTGLFIVDSLGLFDSLQGAATGDSSAQRFSSGWGDSLQAAMGSETTVTWMPFDTNQCIGAVLAGGKYGDGAEAVFSDSVPYKILFQGNSLARWGLSERSTHADVKKRFGEPAVSGEGYEVYLSDQPDEEQGKYYDARWRALVSYEAGKLRKIAWFFYFENC